MQTATYTFKGVQSTAPLTCIVQIQQGDNNVIIINCLQFCILFSDNHETELPGGRQGYMFRKLTALYICMLLTKSHWHINNNIIIIIIISFISVANLGFYVPDSVSPSQLLT